MALPQHLQVRRKNKRVALCESTGKTLNLTTKKDEVECKRCIGRLAKAENGAKPAGKAKTKTKAKFAAKPKPKTPVAATASYEELELAEE